MSSIDLDIIVKLAEKENRRALEKAAKEAAKQHDKKVFEEQANILGFIFKTHPVKDVIKSLVGLGLDEEDVEDLLEMRLISLGDDYLSNYDLFIEIIKKLCENAVLISNALKNWEPNETEDKVSKGRRIIVSFEYPKNQGKAMTEKEKASMRFQQKISSGVFFETAKFFEIFVGEGTMTAGSGIFDSKNGYEWWIHLKKSESGNRIKQMLEIGLKPLQSTFGTCEITFN